MNNYEIIPTSYMQKEDEYKKIAELYGYLGISRLRVNCSRFSLSDYISQIHAYRKYYFNKTSKDLKIILDIPYPGNKNRMEFIPKTDHFSFIKGKNYLFTNSIDNKRSNCILLNNKEFFTFINKGDNLVAGDGELSLKVINKNSVSFIAEALSTCKITNLKSIYSEKLYFQNCYEDIDEWCDFICEVKPEGVVLSFTETGEELLNFKQKLSLLYEGDLPRIIAKIETPQAMQSVEGILSNSDEVMFGRGDMGIFDYSMLGYYQDLLIAKNCGKRNIIVATDILSSIENDEKIPARSDVLDVHFLKQCGIKSFIASGKISKSETYFCRFVDPVPTVVEFEKRQPQGNLINLN